MIFEQFFEPDSSTFTYLLGCEHTRQAVLIDTVECDVEKYLTALHQHGLTLVYTLETHVHADHVTAADALRKRLGSKSVVHRDAGAMCGDLLVTDGIHVQVGSLDIEVRYTPGHTNGCVSYYVGDRIFTGDALLIGGCGRTDFQQGNAGQLYDSIHKQIFSLPDDTLIYPGHDYNGNTVSTVSQEKRDNKRLGGHKSRQDFIEIMANLKLAYPKQIDIALPANQACGNIAVKQSA
ncbi:MBL fold metallo-hydrolase [Methylophilus sp. TWE2]|uniref:MBL fold metallo-hydrolase n=1 Tax=Methylophilus sp. TWE2 TaxID=1662285 RepID=UPI000670F3FD|nr:MBL fold metallo-hydrolase [Methylophilus sp. TWE2]AKR42255.1 Zn-dependent hydrolase [Methylophilus sp. TWE2]